MLNRKLCRPIVGLAVGILAGSAFAVSPAAAAVVSADSAFAASVLATTLDAQLGARDAGSYVDSAGKLVVNVTDSATADSVAAAGATPRYVKHSGATLAAANETLAAKLKTPGTSFAVEPMFVQCPAVRKKLWPALLRTLKPSEQRPPPA